MAIIPLYSKKKKVSGYHGTLSSNVESIKKNNFYETKEDSWIGHGVYFFVDGINYEDLDYCAKMYALDKCKADQKEHKVHEISVLTADISVNEDFLLDLTNENGSKLFNRFRRDSISAAESAGKFIKSELTDATLLAALKKIMGFEFVKANVYIRLGYMRSNGMQSRIDNVTIFAVNNPSKNILKPTIKEVFKGELS